MSQPDTVSTWVVSWGANGVMAFVMRPIPRARRIVLAMHYLRRPVGLIPIGKHWHD